MTGNGDNKSSRVKTEILTIRLPENLMEKIRGFCAANAGSVYPGGWPQSRIQEDVYDPWLVFLLTGIPPLVTAVVGYRNIEVERRAVKKRLHRVVPKLLDKLRTFLNIADTGDERTLILQMFVYIGLFFTLLTIPFLELLRRELTRRNVKINLGRRHTK